MSSTCRVRKPFCWHLKCQRLSWYCTVVRAENTTGSDFQIFGPGQRPVLPKNDLLYHLPVVREWTQRERERGGGGGWGGSKAGAHRFAIFSHDFSLLLLHKKRGILDYLRHSKPERVEDSLNAERTLLPMWLYNSHNRYQIYFWVSKNIVCVFCCYMCDHKDLKVTAKMFQFCTYQPKVCVPLQFI